VYMDNQVFENVMVIVNVIKNILKRNKIQTIFLADSDNYLKHLY
jgi:hypothetical protein